MSSTMGSTIFQENLKRQFSEQDTAQLLEARKLLVEAGLDLDYEDAAANADVLETYFETYRHIPVTVATIEICVNGNKRAFRWLSRARREYETTKAGNPAQMASIESLYSGHGFSDDADHRYENLVLLNRELSGWTIDHAAIDKACGRIAHKAGKQIHFIPVSNYKPSRARLVAEAAKPKPEPEVEYRAGKLNHATDRRYDKPEDASVAMSRAVAAAKHEAESIAGQTHSNTSELQRIFVMDAQNNVDWLRTLESRKRVLSSQDRTRQTSRFIR
jgi:hypothetical protein